MWEKWYEAIKEEKLQSNKDITVQFINFCEATTSCSGGNCGISGKPTSLPTDPPCSQVPGPSRCIHIATGISRYEESRGTGSFLRRSDDSRGVFLLMVDRVCESRRKNIEDKTR